MKTGLLPMAALGLLVSFTCQAAPPASAPAGATALCKDGSYFSGAEKKGACSGHKGLKTWFGATTAKTAPTAKPGMVWANPDTKVYHCPNTRWYGKTKNGKYLSEAEAKAQGMRPDHNKACN